MKKPSVSIFFPCFNDSQSIGQLVIKARETAKSIVSDFEIIVIDDGSSDNSREVLEGLAKKVTELKLIFHPKNRGYGGALKTGFKAAVKDLVFYTDGDGQYDVSELAILYQLMTDDVDVVNGIKMERQDYAYRVVIGNLYALLIRWLFLLPIYDVDCDFRLIKRKALEKVTLKSNSGSICVELVKKLAQRGAKFRQVSVHHLPRLYGNSQFFKLHRLISTFKELSGLWLELMLFKRTG